VVCGESARVSVPTPRAIAAASIIALMTRNAVFAMEGQCFDSIERIRAARIADKTCRQTHLVERPL